VEDHEDARNALHALLELEADQAEFLGPNARIRTFGSGPEFLAWYGKPENPSPDLVILDIGLPGMSGLEVLQTCLQRPAFHRTLFVALTGYFAQDDVKWLAYWFDAYLSKPVDPDRLLPTLKRLLETREATLAARNPFGKLIEAVRELSSLRLRTSRLEHDYIRKLISPEVFKALESGQDLAPRYTDTAVAFADIRGFTQLANRVQISQLTRVLGIFFSGAVRCITARGGFVDKFIGDAVMWFHVDGSEKESASRCIDAAIALIRSTKELQQRIRDELHVKVVLGIGCGIASGEVAVGLFGAPEHRIQYSALGPPVNLASRLCGDAPAGGILIGGSAINHCRYPMRRMGFAEIKGFDHLIEVRRILLGKPRSTGGSRRRPP
jgi:class 3 adenylate cyclase/CheY-like chemotaxis protein